MLHTAGQAVPGDLPTANQHPAQILAPLCSPTTLTVFKITHTHTTWKQCKCPSTKEPIRQPITLVLVSGVPCPRKSTPAQGNWDSGFPSEWVNKAIYNRIKEPNSSELQQYEWYSNVGIVCIVLLWKKPIERLLCESPFKRLFRKNETEEKDKEQITVAAEGRASEG